MPFWYTYKSHQLGYELELNWPPHIDRKIAKDLWINFKTFTNIPQCKWIWVKLSEEYYPETTELNFYKCNDNKTNNARIVNFINDIIDKYWLTIWWKDPSFVWYHIHIFRCNLLNIPTITDDALKITLQFIIDNISILSKQSLYRIIKAHQIWWYYTVKKNNKIREILNSELSKDFNFLSSCSSRPKYQPVILSPKSRLGKLKTLEIRILPTEFLLQNKTQELIDKLYKRNIPSATVDKLYLQIVKHYKKMYIKSKIEESRTSNTWPIEDSSLRDWIDAIYRSMSVNWVLTEWPSPILPDENSPF